MSRERRSLRRLKAFGAWAVTRSRAVSVLEHSGGRRRNLLRVLTYHRVPADFDSHVAHLADSYHVASIDDVLAVYDNGATLPPRSLLITFDDAYRDFAEHAWPSLARRGLPVTLFVPTAFPDHSERIFWWDSLREALLLTERTDALETPVGALTLVGTAARERAFERLRDYLKSLPHDDAMLELERLLRSLAVPASASSVLGWDDLRRLAREGVTLGAHTRMHPLLSRVPVERAVAEVVGSLEDLRREIGASMLSILAYPDGRFTDELVSRLEGEGFVLAFTTTPGTNELPRADRLRLRRINIGPDATVPDLRARLAYSPVYANRWRPLVGDRVVPGLDASRVTTPQR